jgi:hypothetical protein
VAPDVLNHEGANWVNQAGRAYTMTTSHHGEVAAFDVTAAWSESCASCHGEEGRGDGSDGTAIYPRPTDFTSRAYWDSADHARIVRAINEGGAANPGGSRYMPAFRVKYPASHGEHTEGGHDTMEPSAEVLALAEYVASFRPPPAPAPAPTPAPTPAPSPNVAPDVAIDVAPPATEIPPPSEGASEGAEQVAEGPDPADVVAEAEREHAAAFIRERMFN